MTHPTKQQESLRDRNTGEPVTDRELLRLVCDAWVNGRRVIDGIPKDIADEARLRLGLRAIP